MCGVKKESTAPKATHLDTHLVRLGARLDMRHKYVLSALGAASKNEPEITLAVCTLKLHDSRLGVRVSYVDDSK